MERNIFNTDVQHSSLEAKIVIGLERISEAFRVLLWEETRKTGLSPIQIQLLIFIHNHASSYNNVSHLSREFNVTKPTISDAIKVLAQKELVRKIPSEADKRAYSLSLTPKGEEYVQTTQNFISPFMEILEGLEGEEKMAFFQNVEKLILGLNQKGVLTVQRTCRKCRYFSQESGGPYCKYLQKPLAEEDIRLDCAEFEEK